jgi:hypothetical protein
MASTQRLIHVVGASVLGCRLCDESAALLRTAFDREAGRLLDTEQLI